MSFRIGRTIALLAFSIGVARWGGASAEVRVIDGDTLRIDAVTYRLHGIDAPELDQICERSNGEEWWCGVEAASALRRLIAGQAVRCQGEKKDSFQRIIADCEADGTRLNSWLVRNGLAWSYRKYSNDYIDDERVARERRVGIWGGANQEPWVFRSQLRTYAAQTAPVGCPIKGNINSGKRIYHTPGSRWYADTRIDLQRGERWFCSVREARQAGWRPPN